MRAGRTLVKVATGHPVAVAAVTVGLTLLVAMAAALPSIPALRPSLGLLNPITVDTDPENMLSADEPVRVFHDRMKERFELHDMIVVGVVNEEHPEGVFNPASLARLHALTEYAKGLRGEAIGEEEGAGVVPGDVIGLSTVDNIEPGEAGEIRFSWLMRRSPQTPEEAVAVRDAAMRIPFLRDTVVSEDGKAAAVYIPITRKDLSHKISSLLEEEIAGYEGDDQFHITGLPVAEDTFGVEMFIQMAISAPAAMGVIFLLMLVFFRKLALIVSPMIVALVSVIWTMGALVIAGFPIHIMSSMIPIFIMPIAVLDSIHILSDFFEKYQQTRDRERTLKAVMDELFMPMLYTSLTSAAGFASLALTPIPPVQVFGVFVAGGIMVAWLLTIIFIPAYVMFIPPRTLANFGARHAGDEPAGPAGPLGRFLRALGAGTYRYAKVILAVSAVVLAVAGWGISRIQVNDNPVKWFTDDHPIRVADRVLNEHFGGTYMAYLALEAEQRPYEPATARTELAAALDERAAELAGENPAAAGIFDAVKALGDPLADEAETYRGFYADLGEAIREKLSGPAAEEGGLPPAEPADGGPALPGGLGGGDEGGEPALPGGLGGEGESPATAAAGPRMSREERLAWDEAGLVVDRLRQAGQVFKRPAALEYVVALQQAMAGVRDEDGRRLVGKTNSLADIVRTVRRDLYSGRPEDYRVPDNRDQVAQTIAQFQSSHRPDDLWHFVTPDYRTSSLWIQLHSGDNRDMKRVVDAVADYVDEHPPPEGLAATPHWFGLTYINVIWQEKMVVGMLQAFAGSFLVVLLLMTILFRSALWGLLSMIPLTVTIAAIYGVIGIIGKDYDMPVAVLSSLTLGLAVDFAIHFLARGREMHARLGSWKATAPAVFGEPAKAISRNIIVIAAGFLPLLLAPLVPYKTVGVFLATILLISGVGTLLILPAMIRLLERWLFDHGKALGPTCNCVTCAVAAAALVALLALNAHQLFRVGVTTLTWLSLAAVPAIAVACGVMSRRRKCRLQEQAEGRPAEDARKDET
jgi:hypothetical protein